MCFGDSSVWYQAALDVKTKVSSALLCRVNVYVAVRQLRRKSVCRPFEGPRGAGIGPMGGPMGPMGAGVGRGAGPMGMMGGPMGRGMGPMGVMGGPMRPGMMAGRGGMRPGMMAGGAAAQRPRFN